MSQFDNFITLAKRLIAKNGRDVNLLQETATIPDSTKPWRVATSTAVDPLNGVKAVFLEYSEYLLGQQKDPDSSDQGTERDTIKRGDKVCLIASDDEQIQKADIRHYDRIEDGGETWVIVNMKPLQPGEQIIMYEIQVRKL